jgi:hypothetical protein
MPDRPSIQLSPNCFLPIPMGLMIPNPVTTIRFMVSQDTNFVISLQS